MTEEMQELLKKKATLYDQIELVRAKEREFEKLVKDELNTISFQLQEAKSKLREVCTHKNGDGTEAKQKRIDIREIQLYGNTELWYFCTICEKLLQ